MSLRVGLTLRSCPSTGLRTNGTAHTPVPVLFLRERLVLIGVCGSLHPHPGLPPIEGEVVCWVPLTLALSLGERGLSLSSADTSSEGEGVLLSVGLKGMSLPSGWASVYLESILAASRRWWVLTVGSVPRRTSARNTAMSSPSAGEFGYFVLYGSLDAHVLTYIDVQDAQDRY